VQWRNILPKRVTEISPLNLVAEYSVTLFYYLFFKILINLLAKMYVLVAEFSADNLLRENSAGK
jgi:hypothetical protein